MVYYAGRAFPDYLDDHQFIVRLRGQDQAVLTALTNSEYKRLSRELPGRLHIQATYRGWVRMHPDVVHIIDVTPAAATVARLPEDRLE
jgi:hypothetical protein